MNLSLLKKYRPQPISDDISNDDLKVKVYRALQTAAYKYGKLYRHQDDPDELASQLFEKFVTPVKHHDGSVSAPIDNITYSSDAELQSLINGWAKQRFTDLNRAASNNKEVHAQESTGEDESSLTFDKAAKNGSDYDDDPVNTSAGAAHEGGKDSSYYDMMGNKKELMKAYANFDNLTPKEREAKIKQLKELSKEIEDPKLLALVKDLIENGEEETQNNEEVIKQKQGGTQTKKQKISQDTRDEVEELLGLPDGGLVTNTDHDNVYYIPGKRVNVDRVVFKITDPEVAKNYEEHKDEIDKLLKDEGFEYYKTKSGAVQYYNPSSVKEVKLRS